MNAEEPDTGMGVGFVRVRLDLSYDGADFAGWAIQPGQRTVQEVVIGALDVLVPGVSALTVAGRTDAGVHATGQVAHVDIPADAWAGIGNLAAKLSGLLPHDVRVREARQISPGFDARFSALWRRYSYRISDAIWGVEPLRQADTLHWRRTLDEQAMQRAATGLLGIHDFAAYCRKREVGTTIRELQEFTVTRSGHIVEAHLRADAFCHSMVRGLVGALLAVGDGRKSADWPASFLARQTRAGDVQVAPPHGLTLVEVGYPADNELAARSETTRRIRTMAEQP